MSKIKQAIADIHDIDNKNNDNQFINTIHPLVKLILTIVYIIMITSIHKYNIMKLLEMSLYLIMLSMIFDLSIFQCFKKFQVIFILLLVMAVANPLLDRNIVLQIDHFTITSGMISMVTLILKGVLAFISSYFLSITTSIEKICYALKLLHVPNILITIIMLIYRYNIVFLKEIQKTMTAYSLRAPGQKGIHFHAWGSMIGSFMLRSIDKAQVVYQSMEMRGFHPDTYFISHETMDCKSIIYLVISLMVLFGLRFISVFELVGQLFI